MNWLAETALAALLGLAVGYILWLTVTLTGVLVFVLFR